MKVKNGDKVVCLISASPAYTVGKEYTVTVNHRRQRGLIGDDGLFDHWSLLISEFRHVDS